MTCTPSASCGLNSTRLAGSLGNVVAMVVDLTRAYWATNVAVFSKLKSGGPVVTLATGQGLPKTLVPLGGTLYWTNYDNGTLMSAPGAGGAQAVVVANNINHPWGLVATADDVYVSASGANRVLRFKRQ